RGRWRAWSAECPPGGNSSRWPRSARSSSTRPRKRSPRKTSKQIAPACREKPSLVPFGKPGAISDALRLQLMSLAVAANGLPMLAVPEARQGDLGAAFLELRRRFLQLGEAIDEVEHLQVRLLVLAEDLAGHPLLVARLHVGQLDRLVDTARP